MNTPDLFPEPAPAPRGENVLQFRRKLPLMTSASSPQEHNERVTAMQLDRKHLAEWLRELADLIEANALEVEPRAAWLVLSGTHASEPAHIGYGREGGPPISEALRTTDRYLTRYMAGVPRDGLYTHL